MQNLKRLELSSIDSSRIDRDEKRLLVQKRIKDYIQNEIYESNNVEQQITEALIMTEDDFEIDPLDQFSYNEEGAHP